MPSLRLDRRGTLLLIAVGALATIAVVVVPALRFAYRAPSLKIALGTASALVAALVGYLVVGRFRLDRRTDRVIVAYGMFVIAAGDVLLLYLPRVLIHGAVPPRLATWVPLGLHVVGAATLATAATDRFDNRIAQRALGRRFWIGLAPILVILAAAILIHLPVDTTRTVPLGSAGRPQLQSEPFVAAVQLFAGGLLAIAALGFLRRGERFRDEFAIWLALGAGLSAIAGVNFALFPSLFTRWLYTGDVIRLFAYVAWLIGAMVELSSYWEQRAELAVRDERRRLARELHDGLAQELAFITAEVRSWPARDRQQLVASAAERALDESRRAISALGTSSDQAFDAVLRRTLETVADRYGSTLAVFVSPAARVEGPIGEELVRISREAAINACRHGHARSISVAVDVADSVHRLVVRDDGVGFDPECSSETGYGLRSIRERAATIGGEVWIRSQIGRGSEIEVRW